MSLLALLKRRIETLGPLSVADYMALCLLHPEHGYYTNHQPFGKDGDFVTAPEISQLFGEMLGLALAQAWLDRGRPAGFCLTELGPGRGTLMADILRVGGRVPGFVEAAEIWLVEASPALRQSQRDALSGFDLHFADHVGDVPDTPLFLIANEFFDALPIRQYQRSKTGWRERVIGLEDGQLRFGLGPEIPEIAGLEERATLQPGALVQTSPASEAIASEIARRIAAFGGLAYIIDYGDWGLSGNSFQAVRQHRKIPPLDHPGKADLTAHVDFQALAAASAPLRVAPLTAQGMFLERLGITARAQQLAKNLESDALENHIAAHRRLTHPDEMGALFKILGLSQPDAPPLPGLE